MLIVLCQESLSSMSRGHATEFSPMNTQTSTPATQHGSNANATPTTSVLDPRMTPIYVDGGNIISTKGKSNRFTFSEAHAFW